MKHTLTSAALALATGLVGLAGLGPVAAPAAGAAADPVDIRVASFNIQSVSLDRSVGAQRPWRERRAAVIRQILDERVDVIGVQEANPSRYWADRLVDGPNQFVDLKRGLNAAGGHYALASAAAFNCVNPDTSYKCRYRYRAATQGDRILYDTETFERVARGGVKFTVQATADKPNPRYLAWAVLRVRATGQELFFTSAHLASKDLGARRAQWKQMIAEIDRRSGGRPVVSVGDFNTHKFSDLAAEMLPAMKRAGYGDTAGQAYRENPMRSPRARVRTNGWLNSFNHEQRDVATFGYEDARDKVGNGIDWIFASNELPVSEWKVVLDFDPQTLQVRGVLPSDHNMLRATLTLAAS